MGIEGAAPRSAFLGRPWSDHARVAFQSCTMSDVINVAGWSAWNSPSDLRTDHVDFSEYQNVGPGAGTQRSYGHQMTSPLAISDVLGQVRPLKQL